MIKRSVFLMLAAMSAPCYAGVFGPLANFDVVNDTGQTAHGFEIDIDGIAPSDITSLFGDATRWPGMERYGSPVVSTTATGVKIVYQAAYNGGWSAGTPSGTLPVSPSDSCWPYGAPAYGPNYPCDHFGVSTRVNTPNITYKWLVETSPGAASLTPVLATVPNPNWTVTPVPPVNNVPQPPQVNVVIVAPKPLAYEFGEPRWVKVSATGVLQNIAVEDLVAENAIIKQAKAKNGAVNAATQTQTEWQLLQVDSGSPGSGQIDLTGVALDPGATGVVYRFEFYKFTGQRDPQTNEAIAGPNGDTPGVNGPSPGDLGAFIVAQNAGINFDGNIPAAPPLPIAPSLNASINGALLGQPYSQVINATPGNAGDTLSFAVTGLPLGLTVNGNTISGTAGSVGTFPLTITVTDANNATTTTGATNLVVADAPIVFPNPFTLNQGTVGVAYSQPLTVTGGDAPFTFTDYYSLLPSVGLSIVGSNIVGTPTVIGSPSITIVAKDSLGYTQSATATLKVVAAIAPPPPPPPAPCAGTNLVISAATLSSLDIGGGKANPGGKSVTLPAAANISYTAPAKSILAGEFAATTGTVDNLGNCAAASLKVAPGLSLSPINLATGTVGSVYPNTAVTPAGGVGPFTLSVSGLPNGLSFDGANIKGTPALGSNGAFTIVVSINDSVGETVNTTLSLSINPPAAITVGAVSLPASGSTSTAYSGSATATGGVGALTWTATGLPTGLSISAGGVISGTPTTAGTFTPVLTVKDSLGQSKTAGGSISITGPISITASLPATAVVGTAYTATEKAAGGSGALTWSATGLPTGVSISSTGVVSGTPTATGTFNATLTVTDSLGKKATATGAIVVSAAVVAGGPSCTQPAGATGGLNSKGSITAINGNLVTFTYVNSKGVTVTVSVTVPACATIQWNGGAKAFALGQIFEWKGYNSAANGNVAQQVIIN